MPFLKKVVVGEDEDAIAHLLGATLGDVGYLCLRARDGQEVLDQVAAESPDLVILDVLMPKLDGIETVKRLKAHALHARVPVLMLTALAGVDDKVRGLGAGADDYLGKPFDLRELVARASALIRHSRRERDRSPVTNLPGPQALDDEVAARLAAGQPFAMLFLEIEGLDRLVDAEGWTRAHAIVAELSRALLLALEGQRAGGGRPAVLTHLGGDDFAVIGDRTGANGLADRLQSAGDERLRRLGLAVDITLVDSDGARTVDDLARAVARAQSQRAR